MAGMKSTEEAFLVHYDADRPPQPRTIRHWMRPGPAVPHRTYTPSSILDAAARAMLDTYGTVDSCLLHAAIAETNPAVSHRAVSAAMGRVGATCRATTSDHVDTPADLVTDEAWRAGARRTFQCTEVTDEVYSHEGSAS